MDRISNLLRQLADAYDEMEKEFVDRFNYIEDKLDKRNRDIFKIKYKL